MQSIKLQEILATVREDHELVADQLRILEEIQGHIACAEGPHLGRVLELLRGASRFFQTKLLAHFQQEEQGMFLVFRECLPRGSTLVYELEAEHEQMRKLCERLQTELGWLRHAKHRKKPVLADLQTLCAQIVGLLSEHASRETRVIEHCMKCVGGAEETAASSKAATYARSRIL